MDALLSGALQGRPAARASRRSRTCCRAGSSRSPASCTAASAGRGSSRRARRRWARSRSTRGSRSSARRPTSTSSSTRSGSSSTCWRACAATSATSSSGSCSARTRGCGTTCRRASARRSTSACSSSCRRSCATSWTTIGDNIEQLLDVKLMVIRRMEEQPELCNRVFLEVGKKEFRFIINFGFFFGFAIGIPTAILTEVVFHVWWLLPICGVLIGYVTNWLALWMIYEPIEPRKLFGRFTVHGLFIRRQPEVAGVYAGIIADDVITVQNMGEELLQRAALGPHPPADRGRAEAGGRPRGGAGAAGRAGGDGDEGVRHDPRLGRDGGRRVHDDPAHRRGVQPRAVGAGARADPRAHARAAARGLLRDAALGDEAGRMAAAAARRACSGSAAALLHLLFFG